MKASNKNLIVEVLENETNFAVKAQDLSTSMEMFVQDPESEEEISGREENMKNYLLGYAKQHNLCKGLSEELKILVAGQHMDNADFIYNGSGKLAAPMRVTIQKYYEMTAFSEETMQDEVISGWFNLTSKDLGKGSTHKRTDKESGREYRVAHVFEMDAEKVICKGTDGMYDVKIDEIKDDLTWNLAYTAGSFTDLVVIDGVDYRMVLSHSMLSEVIGIDYSESSYKEYTELDGNAVLGVMPKEKYAYDTNKYKENQKDSSKEIMFGKAADVLLGTTALFYSEWQERRNELKEERKLLDISSKGQVTKTAAKIRAISSPFYSLVMELNALYEEGKTRKLSELALKNKDSADDIMDYARRNKKYASLISDRDAIGLTPYLAVRKHLTKVTKKVANKAALIDKKTAVLVRELKKTMNMDLITEHNAKDVVTAARAGGEFRMDGEFKVLYMEARRIQNEMDSGAPVVETKAAAMGAKEMAEARKAARATKTA